MHRALSTLALLKILSPLTASAQRPMNDETLLPLLESAESAGLDEPALARAQAMIVRAWDATRDASSPSSTSWTRASRPRRARTTRSRRSCSGLASAASRSESWARSRQV
jgi:hypothetical protein